MRWSRAGRRSARPAPRSPAATGVIRQRQRRRGLRRRRPPAGHRRGRNTTAAQTYTFNLSAFGTVTGGTNGLVPRWTTVPAGGDRYTRRNDTYLSGKAVRLSFPANSVQTLQIDGVTA